MELVRLVICDPHQLVREGLRALMDEGRYRVSVHAAAADAFVSEPIGRATDERGRPALLVWGPGSSGAIEAELASLHDLGAMTGSTRFVILSATEDVDWIRRVVALGADAILSPDVSPAVLRGALDLVWLGQRLFPPSLARMPHAASDAAPETAPGAAPAGRAGLTADVGKLIPFPNTQAEDSRLVRPTGRPAVRLSEREAQILRCLVQGASNKSIASALRVTETTVKAHLKGLLRTIGVSNRTQAAIWAVDNNFEVSRALGQVTTIPQGGPAERTAVPAAFIGAHPREAAR